MELLLHQVLAGLATGGIYACMALAVVMIYQAIDHLNFAQGEMAMFSTFIAWQLIQWGLPYWVAFGATIVISFAAGVLIERVVLRPRLMLLDEPSFGLAPLVVEELFGILRTLNQTEKVSMLLVEQNAALALDLADHAYLIETGRLVTEGPAQQLRDDENIRRAYLGY